MDVKHHVHSLFRCKGCHALFYEILPTVLVLFRSGWAIWDVSSGQFWATHIACILVFSGFFRLAVEIDWLVYGVFIIIIIIIIIITIILYSAKSFPGMGDNSKRTHAHTYAQEPLAHAYTDYTQFTYRDLRRTKIAARSGKHGRSAHNIFRTIASAHNSETWVSQPVQYGIQKNNNI